MGGVRTGLHLVILALVPLAAGQQITILDIIQSAQDLQVKRRGKEHFWGQRSTLCGLGNASYSDAGWRKVCFKP